MLRKAHRFDDSQAFLPDFSRAAYRRGRKALLEQNKVVAHRLYARGGKHRRGQMHHDVVGMDRRLEYVFDRHKVPNPLERLNDARRIAGGQGRDLFRAQRQADRHLSVLRQPAGTEVALLFGQGDFFCHMKLVKYPAEYERSQIAGDDQDMLAVLQIRRDFARDLLMARRHHVDCNELRARNSLFDVGCGGFYPSNRMDLPAQQDTAVGFDLFKTSGEPFAVAERDAKALISIDRRSGVAGGPAADHCDFFDQLGTSFPDF